MPGATFVASDRSVRSDALLLIFLPLQGGFLLGEHAAQYDGPVAARARHPAQGGRALGCKKSRVVCRTAELGKLPGLQRWKPCRSHLEMRVGLLTVRSPTSLLAQLMIFPLATV